MAEKDLRKWTTFFHEAGVPRGPATEYATLFCNHRIKDDLLGDLTKEILNDIGIIVMGDIMSILKHAKAVYAKLEREKMSNQLVQIPESVDEPEPLVKDNPPLFLSSGQVKKKKNVVKLLNKPKTEVQQTTMLTLPAKKKISPARPKITVTVDDSPTVPKKRQAKTTLSLSERFASKTVSQPKVSHITIEESEGQTNTVKKILTKTKPSTVEITSTGKGVASAPLKRKSAFERLGKEESSSVLKGIEHLSPKIKITKLTKSPVTAPSSKVISLTKSESSVFKRLGETDDLSSPSTIRTGALTIRTVRGEGSRIVSDDSPEKPVKSHSVLRPLKPVQPVKPVSTVKARVSTDTTKESSRKSVFSRLGSQT